MGIFERDDHIVRENNEADSGCLKKTTTNKRYKEQYKIKGRSWKVMLITGLNLL